MSKAIKRLEKILECIDDIEFIMEKSNFKTTKAIDWKFTNFKRSNK